MCGIGAGSEDLGDDAAVKLVSEATGRAVCTAFVTKGSKGG